MEDLISVFTELDRYMEKLFGNEGTGIVFTEDSLPVHTIYVSRLRQNTSEENLRTHFSTFGTIDNIILCYKHATYAFVTFKNPEDATKVLRSEHSILRRQVRVDVADSWHQPKSIQHVKSEEPKEGLITSGVEVLESNPAIFMLNNDCLLHIFSYLDLFDLHSVEQSCQYFKDLTQIEYKKYKILDVAEINQQQPITLMGIRNILKQIGSFINTLKLPGIRFFKPTVRIIELIPRYCKNLKHLSIDGFTMRHGTLHKFRHIFEKLETLELIHCVLAEKVEVFFALAKNMKHLNLTANHELTGKCLDTFTNLESLNLYNCINIQPKFFSQFLKNNKSLKYLNIGRCQRLNPKNIEDMVTNSIELEHLVISNNYPSINNNTIAKLGKLQKLKNIQIIKGGFSNLDNLFLEFANENKLEHLEIEDGILSDEGLKYLNRFTNLKYFKLAYKCDFSDDLLNSTIPKNKIEILILTGCNAITDAGLIEFIKKTPNLKYLDVSGCTEISEQFVIKANEYLSKLKPKHNTKIEVICGLTQICEEIELDHIKVLLKSSFEFQCTDDDDDDYFDYSDDDDDDIDYYDYEYDSDNYYNLCDDSSDCDDFFNYNLFYQT